MKKIHVIYLIFFPILLWGQTAKLKIDINRPIGEIDPNIYGVFMEPIQFSGTRFGLPEGVTFNTLYGSLYDPASPLANESGFRTDIIDAMKELKITNMRWPGGNYVAGYNWQDGIGPKDKRPVRKDLAWGAIENNHVGTDEWIQLNKSIGSENVICVNLGLGNINDAHYWVEYCNMDKGTYFSDLRVKYGHREPYGVKYWCLGNEVDGSPWIMGHKNAEDYCKVAREAAKAMRATDPSIKFISNGSSYYENTGKWIDWNWKVITELSDIADYISIHRYWEGSEKYYEYVGQSSLDIDEKIEILQAQVKVAKAVYPDMKPLALSIDEYAPFGQNMLSTLATAMYLNSFIRHADFVKMANFTLMTSLIGNDKEKGTYETPLFHTFKLFSNNCRGLAINTYVECDTFNTERFKGIPYLDVTSVYSELGDLLFINVVNRNKTDAIEAEITLVERVFKTEAEATEINCANLEESFKYEMEKSYVPVVKEVNISQNKITYTFPQHSITQIKVELIH